MAATTEHTVALAPEPWTGEGSRWQRLRRKVVQMFGRTVEVGEECALNHAPCGRRLKILAVEMSGAQARRITEMGLYHDAEITVLCGQQGGALIVCIDSCRLAVSPTMAEKIRVVVVA